MTNSLSAFDHLLPDVLLDESGGPSPGRAARNQSTEHYTIRFEQLPSPPSPNGFVIPAFPWRARPLAQNDRFKQVENHEISEWLDAILVLGKMNAETPLEKAHYRRANGDANPVWFPVIPRSPEVFSQHGTSRQQFKASTPTPESRLRSGNWSTHDSSTMPSARPLPRTRVRARLRRGAISPFTQLINSRDIQATSIPESYLSTFRHRVPDPEDLKAEEMFRLIETMGVSFATWNGFASCQRKPGDRLGTPERKSSISSGRGNPDKSDLLDRSATQNPDVK